MPLGVSCKFKVLSSKILELSESPKWEEAVCEWILDDVEVLAPGEPGTCLCGHRPILNLCHIKNRRNGIKTIVGNVCVEHFGKSGGIFSEAAPVLKASRKFITAVKKVKVITSKDWQDIPEAFLKLKAEEPLITFAEEKGIFTKSSKSGWDDGKFYRDVGEQKLDNLTERQKIKRYEMNRKLVYSLIFSAGKAFEELQEAPATATAGSRLIEQAHAVGAITKKDMEFYLQNWSRWYYDLSLAQQKYLGNLNAKILKSPELQDRFGIIKDSPKKRNAIEMQETPAKKAKETPAKKAKGEDEASVHPTYLHVPFASKDEVKALGAMWDKESKKWYVPSGQSLDPFKLWMPKDVVPEEKRCYLAVPFAQKDEVKALGARWDQGKKKWYTSSANLDAFQQWVTKA
eukprot:gnl/MRDRNA2_/MRDRNA2_94845_c0_seq1.p1 gnl/MRDRNA2_/MRDRNA2_94845_c0~~gnl/MRDRNA2_/MRDRNA2_94845_c0_seq1.p1  ORF type:complete len:401 (-),score=96.43 gnl/MRDRNA2_/MRDRNA2_94845_c0_seq1:136-1338(-)